MNNIDFPEKFHQVDLLGYHNAMERSAETARENIAEARTELANESPTKLTARTIERYSSYIADQEGRLAVFELVRDVLKDSIDRGLTPGFAAFRVGLAITEMAMWVNDQSSGRTNDMQRNIHDGKLSVIRDVHTRLRVWTGC